MLSSMNRDSVEVSVETDDENERAYNKLRRQQNHEDMVVIEQDRKEDERSNSQEKKHECTEQNGENMNTNDKHLDWSQGECKHTKISAKWSVK